MANTKRQKHQKKQKDTIDSKNIYSAPMFDYMCNWLPFHRPYSFASQAFVCFAIYVIRYKGIITSVHTHFNYFTLLLQNFLEVLKYLTETSARHLEFL